MNPGLFVIGATHHTAPLAVREKLALDAAATAELSGTLARVDGLREFALLSTCNRIEFYGVADSAAATDALVEAFCRQRNLAVADFAPCRMQLAGRDAIQHLFEVATGLDSQMLGENEIFGQVKEAYEDALKRGTAGPVLNRVFQKTFQSAKHARTHTGIASGQVSVANVAVDLAGDIFGGIGAIRVLLLGAGEIGEKTARAFKSRGATSLTVSSRKLERAMELATQLEAAALPFEQREARLADFDIVVGSTAAPGTVISQSAVEAAMQRRPARPLFFIDLALPRDIEASVATLENVFLYNLDDLAAIAERNRVAREAEVVRCREILGERANALWANVESRITALPAQPGPGRVTPPGRTA